MRTGRPVLATLATVLSLATIVLSGCGQEDAADDPGGSVPEQTTPAPSASEGTSVTPSTPAGQSVVEQSIALLADQLGVAPEAIEVATTAEVTWRDGSIGCAKKGMGYTDALVPGSMVELVVDGKTYAFHQAEGRPPFYCKNPTEPAPPS
jgi:hypothetical protein